MISKDNWKKEYDLGKTHECPCCSREDREHVCVRCYTEIDKEMCWRNDGYCPKCLDYLKNELPKIESEKERLGVKCKCNDPDCAKCLSVNCKEDNCPIHTMNKKAKWRKNK